MIGLPLGRFGDRVVVRLPRVDVPGVAPSVAPVPCAVRFAVAGTSAGLAGVGRVVKEDCFPDLPPFVCKVVFARGGGPGLRGGSYADPWSPWCNVFFGGYQVDAPVREWDRPFGFRRAGDELVVDADELVRLGRADWDYFTAYPYGVPLDVVRARRAEAPSPSPARVTVDAVRTAGRSWHRVSVRGVSVVSGYVSGRDGARLADAHRAWSPVWRACFGRPVPRPDHPASFPLVAMRAELLVSWDLRGDRFRTFVCGATVRDALPAADAERLLDAQLAAVRPLLDAAGPARSPTGKRPWPDRSGA